MILALTNSNLKAAHQSHQVVFSMPTHKFFLSNGET
ncbi:hypothetical protein BVRB_5g102200 [Beta vulgaris subsp. vulgaris]|nr:hypothetical protein BVRB_5g102200 [Beta vulgaris subsp. vulgaris]